MADVVTILNVSYQNGWRREAPVHQPLIIREYPQAPKNPGSTQTSRPLQKSPKLFQKIPCTKSTNLLIAVTTTHSTSHTMPQAQPELKKVRRPFRHPRRRAADAETNVEPLLKYLDKRLFVQLNGSRKVIGVLRGYDVRVLSLLRAHGPLY